MNNNSSLHCCLSSNLHLIKSACLTGGRPRLLSILLTGSALLAAPAAHAASTIPVITDNFDAADDSAWERYQPLTPFGANGVFSFPNGGYRIQAPASPNPAALGPGRAGAARTDASFTQFCVSVDLVDWDDSLDQAFGILARGNEIGLGTSDGYAFFYFPVGGGVAFNRIDDEVPTSIGSSATITLDPSLDYRMTFRGVGDALTGEIFELSDLSSPLVSVTANDATYQSGVTALLASAALSSPGGTADATFDNFAATPEPSSAVLGAAGLLVLSFVRRRR